MYAQVQAKFGSADEARMTYRHIQNQRVSLNATFYLTLADFEKEQKDLKRAEDAILLGIKENAERIQELQEALDEMRRNQTFSSMIPPLPPKGMRDRGLLIVMFLVICFCTLPHFEPAASTSYVLYEYWL
jgi:hypothetical protein